jgi:hypothetical protein
MKSSPPLLGCRRLCALVLPLLLSSCFTMGLWGSHYRVRTTGVDTRVGAWEPREGVDWSWWRVLLRIVATPGAFAPDVVTSPFQSLARGGEIKIYEDKINR